jgi:predicted dehydrogenase
MHLELENGAVGVVHSSRMASGHLNDLSLRIYGTKGALDVRYENNISLLRGCLGEDMPAGRWTEIETPPVETNYQRFIAAIRDGRMERPDFRRGAQLQAVLDLAEDSDRQNGCSLSL